MNDIQNKIYTKKKKQRTYGRDKRDLPVGRTKSTESCSTELKKGLAQLSELRTANKNRNNKQKKRRKWWVISSVWRKVKRVGDGEQYNIEKQKEREKEKMGWIEGWLK